MHSFPALAPGDAAGLAVLLRAQRADYMRGFFPFTFDEPTIRGLLERAVKDRYWGIMADGRLAGFFMLRGMDEGYAMPSFGVAVGESCAGRGLATRALARAIGWCRTNGVARLMLKVAEDNAAALAVYRRAGFTFGERDQKTRHLIGTLELGA